MNIYKFSYDDKEDAIRSLANYYQVSDKVILIKGKTVCNDLEKRKDKIYGENEHLIGVREEELSEKIKLEKDKFFYELKNELSPNYSKSNDLIIRINFYHRCSSDGRDSWFQEGLLNSVDGIECFMKKLGSLVPDIQKMGISLESLKNIIRRKGLAEEQSEKDGVNGFYRYKDAIDKENSGFDIPEVFGDLCKGESYQKLKAKILTVLKPTVVKFYVERDITELNNILEYYWESVWNDEEVGQTATNAGRGKTIPYENIERIDYLEKASNA